MQKTVFLKSICIAVVFLFCGFVSVNGADYDWNRKIPTKTPSAEKNNGKLVLFDVTHLSTSGMSDWVIDGGFSDFANALVAEGYTVKEFRGVDKNGDGIFLFFDDRKPENVARNEWVITYDAIKDADVFVLAESNRPFRQDEYAALKKFVDAGKGIYFIADHYNSDRNKNSWDSTETFNGYNRSINDRFNIGGAYGDMRNPQDAKKGWLAETFGLRFRFNAIDWKPGASDITPESSSEGITKGVGPVLIAAGSTLAIVDGNKAKGIVSLSESDAVVSWSGAVEGNTKGKYFGGEKEGPFVAISKPSKGKAAFIGDSSPIEDTTPRYRKEEGGAKDGLHSGWTSKGNAARLSINIVNWLAKAEDYVGFNNANHQKGIETPEPMTPVEKNHPAIAPDPWQKPTIDPWNTATFKPGSYGAPQPFGSVIIPTEDISFGVIPEYLYEKQPFAVSVKLQQSSTPQLGLYLDDGEQVGQVLRSDGKWSVVGYADLPKDTYSIATARVEKVAGNITVKAKLKTGKFARKTVSGLSGGFGFITGNTSGAPGDVLVAVKDGKILGSGLVGKNGAVKIAVKSGKAIKLQLYGNDGDKITALPGSYEVKDNASTLIQ